MNQRVICDEKIISGKYKNNQTVNENEDVRVQVRLYKFYIKFFIIIFVLITTYLSAFL